MNPVIDIQSLNFSYGSVPTLSGINLQVAEGEFLGIVGPNAGGKSTLLKLILGLLQPQSGSLRVLDLSAVLTQVLGRRRAQLAATRGAWQGETRE